ncbi:MAG TPA: helix-turn-helix domain-containing protein [Solirubrobacterales bacterium]|nr:helix-turn-helix domain-containing protein [Solirubrobacterales bacterium]
MLAHNGPPDHKEAYGELPSYKLGASRRIDPADVDAFLESRREEAA